MRTLTLHVGMGKTGTTAIQNALRAAGPALRGRGVFCCDHWLLTETMGGNGFASTDEFAHLLGVDPLGFAARLGQIFDAGNQVLTLSNNIIWSNEALVSAWEAVGAFAADFAAAGDCARIVLYLRHQFDWLVSAYLQWCVKDKLTPGRVIDFERYRAESAVLLDYPALVTRWRQAASPAEVIVRPYEPGIDAVADFASIVGIEGMLVGERAHPTPGHTAHVLTKLVADQHDEPHLAGDLIELLARAGLYQRDFHPVDPCLIDLTDEAVAAIAGEYDARNEALIPLCGFTPRRGGIPSQLGRRPHSGLANTDLIAALLELLLHQHRELAAQRGRIEALEARLGT